MGPAGGIFSSPLRVTALYNRLSSGFPGTIAGPRPPPFFRLSALAMDNPPLGLVTSGPWQVKQFLDKTSRTFWAVAALARRKKRVSSLRRVIERDPPGPVPTFIFAFRDKT